MLATFYFPYVSMLASRSTPSTLVELISNGKIQTAASQVSRHIDHADDSDDHVLPVLLQLQGDLQLALGMEVDADESYRDAQKMMRASKEQMRSASCRNAGWQALFRHRFGTAMSCFTRLVDEPDGELSLRLEGLFGTFGVLCALGRLRDASAVLDTLEDLLDDVDDAHHAATNASGWQELLNAVRFDLAAQSELRSHAELSDHVYWQSSLSNDASARVAAAQPAVLRAQTHAIRAPLLRARIDYLEQLTRLASGERDAGHTLGLHAEWAGKQSLVGYQGVVRLEIVLASLAAGASTFAESILTLLGNEVRIAQTHRHLEYLYCLSKLRHLQGRDSDSRQLYARYAMSAVRCIRDEASTMSRHTQRAVRAPEQQLDDIGARLPARYRRAYRFLVENLERKDLSIREVAAQIGVTERALQSAFKNSLGSTPSEIIRRLRMERIRADLEASDGAHERGILATASRWGVSNRSTLVNGYRREFNEAPSDTLNR